MSLDLEAIRKHWLNLCANCDCGLGNACTCAREDHRPLIASLCDEVERLTVLYTRLDADNAQLAGENLTLTEQLAAAIVERLATSILEQP